MKGTCKICSHLAFLLLKVTPSGEFIGFIWSFFFKGSLQPYLVLSLFNLRNSKFSIVQNKSIIFSSCSGYMQTYYTFSSMAHALSEQNPFLEALRVIISLVVDLHGQFYMTQNHSANTSGWAKYPHHICAVPKETRRLGSRGTGLQVLVTFLVLGTEPS